MIMEYCELLNQNKLSLLEIQEWLIDVNLAITYLLTHFDIKKNSQNYCIFTFDYYILKYLRKKIHFCETCISETLYRKLKLSEI